MLKPYLFVAQTGSMGRRVFTRKRIPAGTIVELSPVIVMSSDERIHLDKTKLHDYIFEWGEQLDHCCIGLGYISIYNHSYKSNCIYEMDYETDTIAIKTVHAIKSGEELFINYNGAWDDDKPLWFDAK